MALWHIELDWSERQVKLIHVDHPGAADALVQKCGQTAMTAESDLEAWVVTEAAEWDVINTTRGTFVRQVFPKHLTV